MTQINSLGNESQVQKMIDKVNTKPTVNIELMKNTEMDKQENNFKNALEEKRKRKSIVPITSSFMEKIDVTVKFFK